MNMKYAVIDQYNTPKQGKNLGDYVQTIAAMQFLPKEPIFVDREGLNMYDGDKAKIIMASWFLKFPHNFPPSEKLAPLFVSSHFTKESINTFAKNADMYDYLKKYEPIGCRDTETEKGLKEIGIDAYFSGCLTLTLGNTIKRDFVSEEILFVDVMYNYRNWKGLLSYYSKAYRHFFGRIKKEKVRFLKEIIQNASKKEKTLNKIFTKDLLAKGTFIAQLYIGNKNTNDREYHLQVAKEYLKRLSQAKLVVTSRIHCALPCLAIGTPVIFIDSELDRERLSGLTDLFNTITINEKGEICSNFEYPTKIGMNFIEEFANKNDYIKYKTELLNSVQDFLK